MSGRHIMEDLCAKSAYDDNELVTKIHSFILDRNISTVTGIRRMSRINTILFFRDVAASMGLDCSIYPDISGRDIVIFEHWLDMEGNVSDVLKDNPDVDILFGQDLCHQVPAIVRHPRRCLRPSSNLYIG